LITLIASFIKEQDGSDWITVMMPSVL